ncbi:MAG: hypothetical protein M3N12_00255 [Verrucomicrobiota bacterium]|nr:hypothetical protein [Verrucomicrobiota bacterium]
MLHTADSHVPSLPFVFSPGVTTEPDLVSRPVIDHSWAMAGVTRFVSAIFVLVGLAVLNGCTTTRTTTTTTVGVTTNQAPKFQELGR